MAPTMNTSALKASENQLYRSLASRKLASDSDHNSIDSSNSSLSNSDEQNPDVQNNAIGYSSSVDDNGLADIELDSRKQRRSEKISSRYLDEERSSQGDQPAFGLARLVQLPAAQELRPKGRSISLTHGSKGTKTGVNSKNTANSPWEEIDIERESKIRRSLRLHDKDKVAFPASASVSLPTSTTTLDYLLHKHDSSGSRSNGTNTPKSLKADESFARRFSHTESPLVGTPLTTRNNSTTYIALGAGSGIHSDRGIDNDYLNKYYGRSDNYKEGENEHIIQSQPAEPKVLSSNSTMTTKQNTANVKMGTEKVSASSTEHLKSKQSNADLELHQKSKTGSTAEISLTSSKSSRSNGIDTNSAGYQFFHVEPCVYTHRMFVRAAKIFEVLKSADTATNEVKASRRRRGQPEEETEQKIPDMDFRDAHEQIKTFELTFATLKYQDIFREILDRTGFFHEFSNLRDDYSLVCIILYDLQSRKFQRRTPLPEEQLDAADIVHDIHQVHNGTADPQGVQPYTNGHEDYDHGSSVDEINNSDSLSNGLEEGRGFGLRPSVQYDLEPVCVEIENALLSRKTRFQSTFAKERIRQNAPSLEHLLPEQVRNKDETKCSTPVYCWVNQLKTRMDKIVESLHAEGFEQVHRPTLDISEQTTKVFRRDPHCSDLLVFPPYLNMFFKSSSWVKEGELVQQDKSSCLAPQTIQHLLGIDQDVIHINIGTGMTTGHISSLVKGRSPHTHIWAFSDGDADKIKKASRNLEFLGAKNTKIVQENFLNIDPEDSRYKNVRVILITANCSKSAITSPVQFIVSEGEDMQILGELSQADANLGKVAYLSSNHESLVKHALKFSRVRAVVYTTRSRYTAENEQVVNNVLETANSGAQNVKRIPFKVTPPVLPFTSDEIGSSKGIVDGRFASFKPTEKSNGCFVAIISREPDDPKEAVKSAIARARSKGMLGAHKGDGAMDGLIMPKHSGKSRHRSKKHSGGSDSTGAAASPNHKDPGATTNGGGELKKKVSSHRSSSVGARLHKAGVISRTEQLAKTKPLKPEHIKVIKHPAPFSKRKVQAVE